MSKQKDDTKKTGEEPEANGNKVSAERLWEATRKTFNSATFKANQYKRIVEKKIDLNAVQKKISSAHADLGKLVDEMHSAGEKNILNKSDIRAMFAQIETLKQTAAHLLEEIESIKVEEEPEEMHDDEPPEQTH